MTRAPLRVLAAIPDLDVRQSPESGQCCGGAGVYGLSQPSLSQAVLRRKLQSLRVLRPDVVATGNPGCAMQIGGGLLADGEDTPIMHPVELLDRSYHRGGYYAGARTSH